MLSYITSNTSFKRLIQNECNEADGLVQVGKVCQKCVSSCKTCSQTPSDCMSCNEGFNLHEKRCLVECPTKFYPENGVCKSCEPPCETCNSKGKCVICSGRYRLLDGNCVDESSLLKTFLILFC